jgi:hypothetical protein
MSPCCGKARRILLGTAATPTRAILSQLPRRRMARHRAAYCRACPLLVHWSALEWCGQPYLLKAVRDLARDGCGCCLNLKRAFYKFACPHGKW